MKGLLNKKRIVFVCLKDLIWLQIDFLMLCKQGGIISGTI